MSMGSSRHPAPPSNVHWLLLVAAWLVTRGLLFASVSADREVTVLFDRLASGSGGDIPAIGWRWLLALPAWVSSSADGFATVLAGEMLLFDVALLALLARPVGPVPAGGAGRRVPADRGFLLAAYLGLTSLLGPSILVRPDLPVALCLGVAVTFASADNCQLFNLQICQGVDFLWVVEERKHF